MIYVICAGTEGDPDDVYVYGPFRDPTWAMAWIKQHSHDPSLVSGLEPGSDHWDEITTKRVDEDPDHWCVNKYISDGRHSIIRGIIEPGFDPTTLPERL